MNPVSIPDSTDSIHNIGEHILEYQPLQNAFLDALVNRIGRVIITSKMWNNPWSVFKKGYLEFGETVEEIFVNIAKPHSFDPQTAEKEVYKRELPDVRAAFHTMNFQKFYKVTISNDQLRQAFLSWQGITDLIAKIVDSLYTGMQYDEWCTMKYMVAREILNGGFYLQDSPDISGDNLTEGNLKKMIAGLRAQSSKLEILNHIYNRAQVMTASPRNDQFVIIDADLEGAVDVEVLASAFNMGRADFIGHLIVVDSFSEHDTGRLAELFGDDPSYVPFTEQELLALQSVNATVVDRDWWMIFDNYQQFTQNYNGQGLYWQYFYHSWKTFSASPFANAIVFASGANEVTGVTVSPATANVAQGSSAQMGATVAGTGIFPKGVSWSIEGQTSSGTTIDGASGVLRIAADETVHDSENPDAGGTITVKATAADGQDGTATITVVSAA
jgi:hypothetical protein